MARIQNYLIIIIANMFFFFTFIYSLIIFLAFLVQEDFIGIAYNLFLPIVDSKRKCQRVK